MRVDDVCEASLWGIFERSGVCRSKRGQASALTLLSGREMGRRSRTAASSNELLHPSHAPVQNSLFSFQDPKVDLRAKGTVKS